MLWHSCELVELDDVLSLWSSLPQLGVTQTVDIAINTISACASIGSPASLQV